GYSNLCSNRASNGSNCAHEKIAYSKRYSIAAHSTFGYFDRTTYCGRRHGGDNLRITPAIHGGAGAVEGDGARALCRPETAAVDLHLGAHRPTCGGQVGDDWVGQAEQHVLVAGDAIDCHLHRTRRRSRSYRGH